MDDIIRHNSYSKRKDLAFPKDVVLRQKWIDAVRRKDFIPSKYSSLCSKHFREKDLDRTGLANVRLRENVVPSVFEAFPSYLQQNEKAPRKPPKPRSEIPKTVKKPDLSITVSLDVAAFVEVSTVDEPNTSFDDALIEAGTADVPNTSSDIAFVDHDYSRVTHLSNTSNTSSDIAVVEHNYSVPNSSTSVQDTPRKVELKRKLLNAEDKLSSSRKKIKLLLQSKRRAIKKHASLVNIITELKKNKLMNDESLLVLEKSAGGVSDLIQRHVAKLSNKPVPSAYSPELRSFAMTLHFYSPHAYRYIRKMFNTCLPHPRTIQRWFESVDGKPGYTAEALRALEVRASLAAASGKSLVCALMMDEVAIRQQVEWDRDKYHGYVDVGAEVDDDSLPIAKEALVFMIVAINDSFKLPVAYFLIDGLGATERGNLVQECISKLHLIGIKVASLTFDGAASNVAMVKNLGCNFELKSENFKTSFPHRVTKQPVAVFLDPCHMLKLVRNTLGDKKSIVDENNNFIKWEYIEKLHQLQEIEGLHLGNRLRHSHMAWFKKKMNVRLAAQLLSESVACSLEFCLTEKMPGFEGCEATIRFIRMFNNLFDILNTRNLRAFGFQSPFRRENEERNFLFLAEVKLYISNLRESRGGKYIFESNRKMGFLGFAVCIDSLLLLYSDLISSSMYNLSFFCTFKISQDHLELFFGKIRSHGGCNNNPTARQFMAAYKRLLIHNEVQDILSGNCLSLQTVPILTVSSSNSKANTPSVEALNESVARRRTLDPIDNSISSDHDYVYIPNPAHLSLCSEKIVAYIAGFVVHRLRKSLNCEACIESLTNFTEEKSLLSLINIKSKGGLISPSNDVIDICLTCEKYFRTNILSKVTAGKSLPVATSHALLNAVLKSYVAKPIFTSLNTHMLECDPLANHTVLLIKAIAEKFLMVRFYYAGKQFTAKLKSEKCKISRQIYTKLIIFSGQ